MTKQPKPYLTSITSGIEAIESYLPQTEDQFIADHKTQDAVLMRLQDIGENLAKIRDNFPEFWEAEANAAWIKAIGLRNIIAHGYAEISLEIIWELVTKDLNSFKDSIQKAT